jgi:hypothetical protein
MIERVIRYSTMSKTATTKEKNKKPVYKEYLALPSYLLAQVMHTQPKTSSSRRRPVLFSGALGAVCFFS